MRTCTCWISYPYNEVDQWTSEFRLALIENLDEIEAAFNDLVAVYDSFITKSQKSATDLLWHYVKSNKLLENRADSLFLDNLLFRGRKREDYDPSDVAQYYHLPFNLRCLVGNQRFSVSGQPMIYFGSSALCVAKELGLAMGELNLAAFIFDQASSSNMKIFSLRNKFNDTIENALPGIAKAGVNVSFDDERLSFSRKSVPSLIREAILFHICTFPKSCEGKFIAEYAIPQMLTTALLDHGYDGLVFPSTKDYGDLAGHHQFSAHHINLAMFVPYESTNNYGMKLLSQFESFLPCPDEDSKIDLKLVRDLAQALIGFEGDAFELPNGYRFRIAMMGLHLEYLENATVANIPYFDSEYGKAELRLYAEMLQKAAQLMALD